MLVPLATLPRAVNATGVAWSTRQRARDGGAGDPGLSAPRTADPGKSRTAASRCGRQRSRGVWWAGRNGLDLGRPRPDGEAGNESPDGLPWASVRCALSGRAAKSSITAARDRVVTLRRALDIEVLPASFRSRAWRRQGSPRRGRHVPDPDTLRYGRQREHSAVNDPSDRPQTIGAREMSRRVRAHSFR